MISVPTGKKSSTDTPPPPSSADGRCHFLNFLSRKCRIMMPITSVTMFALSA